MKHCIFLKATFETPLLLVTEVYEQTPTFDYYKYNFNISCMIKKLCCGHVCY